MSMSARMQDTRMVGKHHHRPGLAPPSWAYALDTTGAAGQWDDVPERVKPLCAWPGLAHATPPACEGSAHTHDAPTEGIWLIDADHKTTFMNRSMADMLGCAVELAVGRPPHELLGEAGLASLGAYLELPHRQRAEVEFLHADGTLVRAVVDVTATFDSAGRYSGSRAMMKDISGRSTWRAP